MLVGKKSKEQVLREVGKDLVVDPIPYARLDLATQQSLHHVAGWYRQRGEPVSDPAARGYYLVAYTQASRPYYHYLHHHFLGSPSLYIYDDPEQQTLSSNCELLSVRLGLMAGISEADVSNRTPAYRGHVRMLAFYQKMWEQSQC